MIKGIIFDLDGTTIYTIEDLTDSVNAALRQFGFPERSIEEAIKALGRGRRYLINKLVPEGTDEETELKVGDLYWEIYKENYDKKSKAYEGMNELLRRLQDKGIKLAVNSNKGDELTKKLIAKCYPDIEFVAVYGSRPGVHHKPDPTGALQISELMGLKNEEVMYVGDSEVDIETARNANMVATACSWGYRDLETLEECKPDHIIHKPEELLRCIDE